MTINVSTGNTTIAEILTALAHGELSQYSFGIDGIEDSEIPKVMSAINRGVNQIQLDLSIHENNVQVVMVEGVLTYHIHSKHSVVTGTDPVKYVYDSIHKPFEDDILRVQQIYTEGGREVAINVRNDVDTIYMPSHNTLQIPYAREGEVYSVVYTQYTKPLSVVTMAEAGSMYLPIPDYTHAALFAYVASRMTAGITNDQEINESRMWKGEYEQEIARLKHTPSIEENGYQQTKLNDRGFV